MVKPRWRFNRFHTEINGNRMTLSGTDLVASVRQAKAFFVIGLHNFDQLILAYGQVAVGQCREQYIHRHPPVCIGR